MKACPLCGHKSSNPLSYMQAFEQIVTLICERYSVTPAILESKGRLRKAHSWPRQLAMALVCKHTGYTYVTVGDLFKCCPNNVAHACNAVRNQGETNAAARAEFLELEATLQSRLAALRGPVLTQS